jgi:hypothetical protein
MLSTINPEPTVPKRICSIKILLFSFIIYVHRAESNDNLGPFGPYPAKLRKAAGPAIGTKLPDKHNILCRYKNSLLFSLIFSPGGPLFPRQKDDIMTVTD